MLTDTHGLTDVHAPPGSLATATCRRRRCPQTSSKSLLVSPSRLELVSGPLIHPIVFREAANPLVLRYSVRLPRSREAVGLRSYCSPGRLSRIRKAAKSWASYLILPTVSHEAACFQSSGPPSSRPPPPLSSVDHLPRIHQPS